MLLVALIALSWIAVMVLVVGLCVAAKRGDAAQSAERAFVLVHTQDRQPVGARRELPAAQLTHSV